MHKGHDSAQRTVSAAHVEASLRFTDLISGCPLACQLGDAPTTTLVTWHNACHSVQCTCACPNTMSLALNIHTRLLSTGAGYPAQHHPDKCLQAHAKLQRNTRRTWATANVIRSHRQQPVTLAWVMDRPLLQANHLLAPVLVPAVSVRPVAPPPALPLPAAAAAAATARPAPPAPALVTVQPERLGLAALPGAALLLSSEGSGRCGPGLEHNL